MKIELQGVRKAIAEIEKRQAKMEEQLGRAVRLAAQDIRNACIISISKGSRTGKIYRAGTDREHQASAPGEPPKKDNGGLTDSLDFKMTGKLSAISGSIAGDVVVEYAKSLEFGTRKMAPRPFLVPAVEKMRPKFNERVKKIMEAVGS